MINLGAGEDKKVQMCVCAPGVCVVDELEQVLEVLRNPNDDVLRRGDGAAFVVFGLHHTFNEAQPVELQEGQGNTHKADVTHIHNIKHSLQHQFQLI